MNSTQEEWHGNELDPVITTLNVVISFLSLLGNGMVVTVMLARRRVFSSFTNRLLLHQSIIDANNGFIFLLHRVVKSPDLVVSEENNFYDQLVCRVLALDILLWCGYVISTYNLVLISLERYMAICYPVKHRRMENKHKLKIAIGVLWAVGVVYCLPPVIFIEPFEGRCQYVANILDVKILIGVLLFLVEYFAPLGIMVFAYGAILIKLQTRLNDLQNVPNQARRNVIVTILVMSVLFVICWTPAEFHIVIHLNGPYPADTHSAFATASTLLVGCNMFVNPIVYCFMYKQFRDQLKDVVLKRLRRNQVHGELQL